jgi:hypothetical protein
VSRVVINELLEGVVATAASVNLTTSRWNTATGAGMIDGSNIREEGLDRGAMAQHVLNTQRAGATPQVVATAAYAPGVFPNYMVFDTGTTLGPITVSATDKLLVCYSLFGTDANNSIMETVLRSSPDNITYSDVAGTWRRRRCRVAGNLPRATGSLSAKYLWTTAQTVYFRVQVNGSAAASFNSASLWAESLAT